jgi:HAD superfamily hydrolase (TIGR01490 family)
VAATVTALARHRAAGHIVVLVSGSFRACLDPLARELGARLVLCTEPIVDADGRLTGEVRQPMIGSVKVASVAAAMTTLGVRPADCHAYGDHASDLGMLAQVGHPAVVGTDTVLVAHATLHGWPVLPATGRRIADCRLNKT